MTDPSTVRVLFPEYIVSMCSRFLSKYSWDTVDTTGEGRTCLYIYRKKSRVYSNVGVGLIGAFNVTETDPSDEECLTSSTGPFYSSLIK